MRNPFEGHSPWWGITARFLVVCVVTYIPVLLLRIVIATIFGLDLWGWWGVPLHVIGGFISGFLSAEWIMGPSFRIVNGKWRRNY